MSYDFAMGHHIPDRPRNRFSVKVARSKRRVPVTADYYRVDAGGVLSFKNADCQFHTVVRVFAPGYWLELERLEDHT